MKTLPIPEISVVIVDDNPIMRALLRQIINGAGHQVVGEATDADMALGLVERLRPQVITLDLTMPGGSGIDLIPDLRRVSPDSHILVVTSTDDQEIARRTFKLGVTGYVVKPFNADRILDLFDKLVVLSKRAARTAVPSPQTNTDDRKRCVIADDNNSLRSYLKAVLEHAGVEVLEDVADGMEALLAVDRTRPHFVCLDIDMPHLDGLNALNCLRSVYPDLPVMMVTAHLDRDTVAAAVERGVQAYLVKPFNPEKVVAVLRKLGMVT